MPKEEQKVKMVLRGATEPSQAVEEAEGKAEAVPVTTMKIPWNTMSVQGVEDIGRNVGHAATFDSGFKRLGGPKRVHGGKSITGPSFQWAAVWLGCLTLSVAGGFGGGWVRDLHADGDVEPHPGPGGPGSESSLVGEDPGWVAAPRYWSDLDYSESSGSLLASERWSGEDRPANPLLGNFSRAQRDIARLDAVLAGQRPMASSIARFEHPRLGERDPNDSGNVWNVERGLDLRDMHRVELEVEPMASLLSPAELAAQQQREDVAADGRSDNLSELRSWRSREWFHGPQGPRRAGLGIFNRYSRNLEIVRDQYLSRGWSFITGEALVDVSLRHWGRLTEAEQYERVVIDGFPRLRERAPVRMMPYDDPNWREARRSIAEANRVSGAEPDAVACLYADPDAVACSGRSRPPSPEMEREQWEEWRRTGAGGLSARP